MKKIVAILMAMLMVMSVTVVLASGVATTKEEQPGKNDLQIFEKGINVLGGEDFVPGEFIVKFKPGVGTDKIDEINSKHGAFVKYTSPYGKFTRIGIPPGKEVSEMVGIYSKNPNVVYAEPNHIDRALWVPNDPGYYLQWHLDNTVYGGINMESAWDISTGTGVIVAVLDTGVAYEVHEEFVDNPGRRWDYWITYDQAPDLAGTNFVTGYDFVNDDEHPNDDDSHGTHVAGTIAQTTNNEEGVAGVAFDCSIMPIKTLNADGSGTHTDFADGVYFAVNNGADVISYSGGGSDSITKMDAVKFAYNNDVTFVAAAGNDGPNGPSSYPAAYDAYCIAVGATRYDETVSYYSTTGDYVDIAAPGGDMTVNQNGDGYVDGVLQNTFNPNTKDPQDFGYWFFEGTSMATPHVSGVAALLIANGVTGPDNVREALESTAEDKGAPGWDQESGWGIVDAYAALQYSFGPKPPVADAGPDQTLSDADNSGVETVTLNGSASYDPDGSIVKYVWKEDETELGTGEEITYDFTVGTHNVTLTVTDNDGLTDSYEVIIAIEANKAPVADAGSDKTVSDTDGDGVEAVTLHGSGSYDPDGSIFSYEWKEGADVLSDAVSFTNNFALGTHIVTLTVTDDGGASSSDDVRVTVTEAPTNTMHVAKIVMSTDNTTRGRNTFVWAVATVTIVDADEKPVNGATVSGTWSELTSDADLGQTGSGGTVALNSDSVKNAAGTFTFTVTGVERDGWIYNSDANIETSGSILV